jgi:hypothetical protein
MRNYGCKSCFKAIKKACHGMSERKIRSASFVQPRAETRSQLLIGTFHNLQFLDYAAIFFKPGATQSSHQGFGPIKLVVNSILPRGA